MYHHTAFYISNKDNKKKLIEGIISGEILSDYIDLKGALFSELTVNKIIEEEKRHGRFDVVTSTKNSLEKSSEGERRKALLAHIISKKPDYIIVDNVFDNLDVNAQENIVSTLSDLSKQISIIQIANRRLDILPFIEKVYKLQEGNLIDDVHLKNQPTQPNFIASIPKYESQIQIKGNTLIKFNDVTINYKDRTIVKNIFWEVKKEEFWHLKGPNGSGKSTLLSLITGDNVKGYNKDVMLFGVKKGSGESVWDIKKKIGYFSSEMLRGFKRLDSIGNMIASGFYDTIGLYKTPTNAQIKITHQWLHVLNMYDIRKKNFLELSRGHQRLVLIARAMVKNPPLLILDEPLTGLDDNDISLFSELINKIAQESNTSILYVSHRKEPGLNPDYIYELIPGECGSIGREITQ
ncbi:ATP-binding cassette domain-containing protein [Flavivirga aquimarina]|uniref:ATP-binding cassette domain-containing protein n=1 Tax=Flavivirga aquimarina TaxID=2027862 RepID=A0ABT8WFY8_9FLAO|nr:ATP-binding cassette domain-containing protein [Flavivirga aquimarina]MDO5972073.1 ATP-binding cassette domain-containing protein [Flavivirga aquimarina]